MYMYIYSVHKSQNTDGLYKFCVHNYRYYKCNNLYDLYITFSFSLICTGEYQRSISCTDRTYFLHKSLQKILLTRIW